MKVAHPINVLTVSYLVVRAYLYFAEFHLLAAILDHLALAFYLGITILDKKYVYISTLSLVPATSIFYIPTGLIPFDLSMVIIFLISICILRSFKFVSTSKEFIWALVVYASLCLVLISEVFVDLLLNSGDFREQMKVLYLLVTATIAAYLFRFIFDPRDSELIMNAIVVVASALVAGGLLGYLFPLSTYTWQLEADFHFKSLFRYPGMSSSNYISHVLLLLGTVHYWLGNRMGTAPHILYYLAAASIVAVLSQSRGFVLTLMFLVVLLWAIRSLNTSSVWRRIRRLNVLIGIAGAAALAAVFVVSLSVGFLSDLVQQTVGRFQIGGISSENIGHRLDEWQQVFRYFHESGRSILLGNGYFPEGLRPHNLILTLVLIFGAPLAMLLLVLFGRLMVRRPLVLFAFIGSQAEILFVTGTYDFLFLLLLLIVSCPHYWFNDSLIIANAPVPRSMAKSSLESQSHVGA